MHRHAHRGFVHAQAPCAASLCDVSPLPAVRKYFQLLEQLRLALGGAFLLQTPDDFCQQRQRPFAVERLVGTRLVRGGDLKFRVRRLPVERQRRLAAAAFLAPATCPIRSRENVSATPAGTRGTVRARRSSRRDNFSPETAQRTLASNPPRLPCCARAGGRRRKAETSRCGTIPPARDPPAACAVCPPRARPSNASWRRCRPARSRPAWNFRRSNHFAIGVFVLTTISALASTSRFMLMDFSVVTSNGITLPAQEICHLEGKPLFGSVGGGQT